MAATFTATPTATTTLIECATRCQDPGRCKDKLTARLTKLGHTVSVQPAQAV